MSARLSRLEVSGSQMTGAEQVLVEDWFQQYPGQSIGGLAFGPDGALYASAGDGARLHVHRCRAVGEPEPGSTRTKAGRCAARICGRRPIR